MEDTADKIKELSIQLLQEITDYKGKDARLLDVREQAGWTDYFIIATANSQVHMRGLSEMVQKFLKENDQPILNKSIKRNQEGWLLVDAGDMVIHIMTKEMRNFYDLEKMWFKATDIRERDDSESDD